jgi:hypothetical protein
MFRTFSKLSRLAVAVSLAACTSEGITAVAPTPASTPARSDDFQSSHLATVRWNDYGQSLVSKNAPGQQPAIRMFAYLSLAQYDALASLPEGDPNTPALQAGVAAGASSVVLAYVFPNDAGAVAERVGFERGRVVEGVGTEQFDRGVAIGREIGANVVAHARTDRFGAAWNGSVPTGQGFWYSAAGKTPVQPMLGQMRPFFMTSGDQFRPAPPPAFGSDAYRIALAEVRKFSDTRTQEQQTTAEFWAMATGSLVAGYWNAQANSLVDKYHLNEIRAAHALALMNMSVMDANIACHDAKYTYWMIRPSQADANIRTAIGLPNHPSYPSNHSCDSGAAAYVLGALFPAEHDQLEAQAIEAGLSRLYAGLHYRFDLEAGLDIARKVSALALASDVRGREAFELRDD